MTPQFMQPKPLPTRFETECEICYLQKRIAEKDGMIAVLQYRLEQQQNLLKMVN